MPPVASHPCPMPDAFERSVPVSRRVEAVQRVVATVVALPRIPSIKRSPASKLNILYSDLSYVTNDDRSCAIWRTCVRGGLCTSDELSKPAKLYLKVWRSVLRNLLYVVFLFACYVLYTATTFSSGNPLETLGMFFSRFRVRSFD